MIKVENLSFAYASSADKKLAINNIEFQINAGEIFGFLGPSGAGKSTTQKLLIGLLSGYEGMIEIMDRPLRHWNASFYELIGVGFELPNHYLKLSAIENLNYFSSFYERKTRDPMELLSLVGLDSHANKRVEEYSKGMKMRLNFIRTMLHDPKIYFLDEPTAGLDPVNARNMKSIIKNLRDNGKTIFLTTHNMHDADELCDKVAFLVDGEIKITDSPKTLKLNNGHRKVVVEYGSETPDRKEFGLDQLHNNKQFLDILGRSDLLSIHSQEATLDEVFVKVTGKSLD